MSTLRLHDDLGRILQFARPPERVVSLVPSDSYSVWALGHGAQLVGRTRYCDMPADIAMATVIGGTKDVDVASVLALEPDLVLANQEENTRPVLEALAAAGVRVLVSLPRRVDAGLAHLARLARILSTEPSSQAQELLARGYRLRAQSQATSLRVFAPIWNDPWMTFNGETYGHDVLNYVGATNVFGDRARLYPLAADLGKAPAVAATGRDERYPRISLDELSLRSPDMVLLTDEPHDFTEADEAALRAACPGAQVVRASGKDLFWHGAWAIDGIPRLAKVLTLSQAR